MFIDDIFNHINWTKYKYYYRITWNSYKYTSAFTNRQMDDIGHCIVVNGYYDTFACFKTPS